MTLLERIRAGLLAPEDAPASGAPAPGAEGGKGAAPAGGEEKKPDAPAERKSVLKAPAEADAAKKDGEGGEEKKPDKPEEKKPEEKKDEPYEVKAPEGLQVDKAGLDKFSAWAKEKGLTAAHASEAVAFYAQMQKGQHEAWAKQGDTWYGELEKDAEFGGAKLKESEAALQRAVKRFDPKGELAGDLEKYGIDNLPSLARFLARVGRAGGEDKALVEDAKGGAPKPTTENERLAREFPSLAKELLK